MPRRPRLVVPGVPHHVTQRGNNRQHVFFSDQDRTRYLYLLHQYAQKHDFRILGWCLMTNHVHLIVIPGNKNSLALTLAQTHSQYSIELNRTRDRVGHLWHNRFFSCPLDSTHLLNALRYVDLNPVRAGLTLHAKDWRWSSARAHLSPIAPDALLDSSWTGWMNEARIGWDYFDWNTALAAVSPTTEWDRLRRATKLGEPFGSENFLSQLETVTGRPLRVKPSGRPCFTKVIAAAS